MKLIFLICNFLLFCISAKSHEKNQINDNSNHFSNYTDLVLEYRKLNKLDNVYSILKKYPNRDVILELISSSAKYSRIRGVEGAPFVPLIRAAQEINVEIFKEEFLNFSKVWIENKDYEILLKCGYFHMHDIRYGDLILGDSILRKICDSENDNHDKILSIILSKHIYQIYIIEQIRRLEMLENDEIYIKILEKIRTNYMTSKNMHIRVVEEVVDKCNRAIEHVKKLKK